MTDCFCYQHPQQKVITVPTFTIIYPLLGVTEITYIHDIPKSVCNRTQAKDPYQDILYV